MLNHPNIRVYDAAELEDWWARQNVVTPPQETRYVVPEEDRAWDKVCIGCVLLCASLAAVLIYFLNH